MKNGRLVVAIVLLVVFVLWIAVAVTVRFLGVSPLLEMAVLVALGIGCYIAANGFYPRRDQRPWYFVKRLLWLAGCIWIGMAIIDLANFLLSAEGFWSLLVGLIVGWGEWVCFLRSFFEEAVEAAVA